MDELNLVSFVIERWLMDCRSKQPSVRDQALADLSFARHEPDKVVVIAVAAAATGQPPELVLAALEQRAQVQSQAGAISFRRYGKGAR